MVVVFLPYVRTPLFVKGNEVQRSREFCWRCVMEAVAHVGQLHSCLAYSHSTLDNDI